MPLTPVFFKSALAMSRSFHIFLEKLSLMHTLMVTSIGLLSLLLTALASRLWGWNGGLTLGSYLVVWLIATVTHGAYGVFVGESIAAEIRVFLLVYGLPAVLAGLVYRFAALKLGTPYGVTQLNPVTGNVAP